MTDAEQRAKLTADLAESKAKIEEAERKLAEKDAELVKKDGIVTSAEAKFNEMAGETGENRKAATEAMKALLATQKERDAEREEATKARDELAELKKTLGSIEESTRNNQKTTEEKIDELSTNLTEDDLNALDAARESADPETQKAIDAGGEAYLEFLKGFKETQQLAESDRAPWRKKPAQGVNNDTDNMNAKMRALFNREKQRAESYPDGHTSGQRGGRTKPAVSTRPPQKVVKKDWGIAE